MKLSNSETMVRALLLKEREGTITSTIEEVDWSLFPKGNVTVQVIYSTLNYKDGLILKGIGKLVRSYPHIPGIDFSGIVEQSDSPLYHPGDRVILTGWRVGELWWGGYAAKACVQAEWLVPMPDRLNLRHAMTLGTAGFTAMLAIMALEAHGLSPKDGEEVLVTGATGGLASVAIAILASLGYQVVASTGKRSMHNYLRTLGATRVIDRNILSDLRDCTPIQSRRWSGAIDSVGSAILSTVTSQMRNGTAVAVCGNAGGSSTLLSTLPLILRGVSLFGIASVLVPLALRMTVWQRLSHVLSAQTLDFITHVEPLSRLPALADCILQGNIHGRTVIDVNT